MAYGSTNKDGPGAGGDNYWLLQDSEGRLRINDEWEPELQADETADDSDKSFTVDTGEEWIIQWIYVELTSTATAGSRELVVEIQDDSADVIATIKAGAVQAASLTYYYMFSPHVTELTAVRGTASATYLSTIMPPFHLPAAYVIRVYDSAAVAAAADDMIVQMGIKKRTA